MTPESIQAWVAVVGGLCAGLVGLFKYFNYRSRRDRLAEVGASFVLTMESLASDNPTSRMAGAVLLRRFFDRHTEQGAVGRPYVKEAIEVIAGMLREEQPPHVQKVLADGLRYARQLPGADLQNCNLRNAYLGTRTGDKQPVDLTRADLYASMCERASFKGVIAVEAVFMEAELNKAVFTDANCTDADFRWANLEGAKFEGAHVEGARFEGATGVPEPIVELLTDDLRGRPGARVAGGESL